MYQLRSFVSSHKNDVLCLAITADDCIVSCSRDQSAKLWKLNRYDNQYFVEETYITEQNLNYKFPTSVCALLPSDLFEYGLILIGDNDNNISVFETYDSVPMLKVRAHSNAVCKIVDTTETNTFLSASWDGTVKMWSVTADKIHCILEIPSYSVSVWAALQTKRKLILTGSADKLIRVFNADGSFIRLLSGHEGCVRDLVETTEEEVLSCSNDTTVRRWSVTSGECLEILYGHPNYVYCVRILGDLIVSCGEDGCLFLWSRGKTMQTITLPARSVWNIGVLSNNDIVTGTSDGVMRIFTSDVKRIADQKTVKQFDEECVNFQVPRKIFIKTKISRTETALPPGTKEGEMKFVREFGNITSYSWSAKKKKWTKLGIINSDLSNVISRKLVSKERKGKNTISEAPEGKFVCAVCRRAFSCKVKIRKHCERTDHSVANKIPFHLSSILPRTHPVYLLKHKTTDSCSLIDLCLPNLRSIADLQAWICRFGEVNSWSYRKISFKRFRGDRRMCSEFYRCQQGPTPPICDRKKFIPNCRSTIYAILKTDVVNDSIFCRIRINFAHNHAPTYSTKSNEPTVEVEDMFRKMFFDGLSPASAFYAYRQRLTIQSSLYNEAALTSNHCVYPDYRWVDYFYRMCVKHGELFEKISSRYQNSDKDQTCVDYERPTNVVETAQELENCQILNLEELIAEERIDDCDSSNPHILEELMDEFDIFLRELDKNPRYYEEGVRSMSLELKKICESSAESRLCALYSFNKNLKNVDSSN